ncbi:hypothetical protein FMN50_21750 [Rhodobacterales bacterium]|nr:hypothetical protein FMN50_21750 [Rhodobacterales bacterium]
MTLLAGFVCLAVVLRLATLAISIRNEKRLRLAGAQEYGARTSKAIAVAHVVFYLAAIAEGYWHGGPMSWVSYTGIAIYLFSMAALFWVISNLGSVWTVKVFIAPDHKLNTGWLFRKLRHPNYFLNILPELVGFALALQAYGTLVIGLPIYALILARRIREEEEAMHTHFPQY